MEVEKQTIEWKESWKDEFLAWLCGYANAKGGTLFIGRDDEGNFVPLNNAKKLLEDLPNKIRDTLGIIADVNLHTHSSSAYIEIIVEPYPTAISYKGEYHYRTGSTKQLLKGNALNKFLLDKMGKKWDAIPIPNITIDDLDEKAFKIFREKAILRNRVSENAINISDEMLLESLNLFDDNNYLKRAGALLFHPNPEKYITGAYIKIAYFEENNTMVYQDEIRGSLFTQIEQTIDFLQTKYLKANISYTNLNRIESPYPIKALREILLNAVAHKNYSSGNPIQIKVFNNKIEFWNEGSIPIEWTLEKFLGQHPSKPSNPEIADVLFRAGYIEAWGLGIGIILSECDKNGLPKPVFNFEFDGLKVELSQNEPYKYLTKGSFQETLLSQILESKEERNSLNDSDIEKLIPIIKTLEIKSLKIIFLLTESFPLKRKEIMETVQLTNQTFNIKRFFDPLLKYNIVTPIIKERPNSKHQQYLLTTLGKKVAQILKEAFDDSNIKLLS